MTDRLTLPQQRARETRQRILDAATRVFARRGYGQATVSEIAIEAGTSMGALYHHFPSKEDLFRLLLDDHIRGDLSELASLPPASSFREVIAGFVAFWVEHLQSNHEFDPLFVEFCAQATREDWARGPVSGFFRLGRDLIAGILRICQSAGVVRPDLDVDAAAMLLHAAFDGTSIEWAVDPESVDLQGLVESWVDLIVRFVGSEGEADIPALQAQLAAFSDQLSERQVSPENAPTGVVAREDSPPRRRSQRASAEDNQGG